MSSIKFKYIIPILVFLLLTMIPTLPEYVQSTILMFAFVVVILLLVWVLAKS